MASFPSINLPQSVRVSISSNADILVARQRGRQFAEEIGFSSTDQTFIATAVSALARNIVRFAHRGEIAFSPIVQGASRGIRVVASDSGPGIADPQQLLQAGRARGLGVAGVRTFMDEIEIDSSPDRGTTVTARKWAR